MSSLLKKCSSAALAAALGSALAAHAAEVTVKEEPAARPGGRVQLASEVVDAGDVVRGQEAKATFLLENTSDQVVRILSVKPSCGCTVASFDETVAPGESGKVTAAVKTENFRGPIEKTVMVTTDDPARSSITLRVKANVVGSVVVLPRQGLAFPTGIDWDYHGKLVIRKDPTEKGELKITDVSTPEPWLIAKAHKVKSREPAAEGIPEALPGDWILDVSVGEGAPKSQSGYILKFKTGLPREAEVSIPISVVLQSPMRATPSPLNLPAPKEAGQETSATLSAVVRPGLGKETVTATASPDAFGIRVEREGDRRYKATVSWKPVGDSAPREGTVVFRIGQESITVPVRVSEPKSASLRPQAPATQ